MEIHLFSDGAPVQSTVSLTEGHFGIAGQLMASSIWQGGPAPNFLAGWVYQYISGGLSQSVFKWKISKIILLRLQLKRYLL